MANNSHSRAPHGMNRSRKNTSSNNNNYSNNKTIHYGNNRNSSSKNESNQNSRRKEYSSNGGNYNDKGKINMDKNEETTDTELSDELSESLRQSLINQGVFETEEGEKKRQQALDSLEFMLTEWSKSLQKTRTNNVAEHEEENKVSMCTFGSYHLGVHRSDADIDALVLAPHHCTREDFFSSFVAILDSDPRITQLHPIPAAYTPVIKFKMDQIPIDLVFAKLNPNAKRKLIDNPKLNHNGSISSHQNLSIHTSIHTRRHEFRIDDSHLIGVDEAGVRSLNGVRVTQYLLEIVPNVDHFRTTLRAIKQWATIHGLYSNVLGFLGGINWAILVACTCKHHPNEPPSKLLHLFFHTYAKWRWPRPVKLVHAHKLPPPGVLPLPVWNPKLNPRDGSHLMPILTPAYPSMNSSYNVGRPQLRRLQQELKRGEHITASILYNTSNEKKKLAYDHLFSDNNFFEQHEHYLQVNIIAKNARDFRAWFGLCESRLRILIVNLDSPEYGVEAFPFAKFYHRRLENTAVTNSTGTAPPTKNDETNDALETKDECRIHVSSAFIALRFAYGIENIDLQRFTQEFLHKVNTWDDRRYGMDLTIEHRVQQHLPRFVFESNENQEKVQHQNGKLGQKRRPSSPSIQKVDTKHTMDKHQNPKGLGNESKQATPSNFHNNNKVKLPKNPKSWSDVVAKKHKDDARTGTKKNSRFRGSRMQSSSTFPNPDPQPSPSKRPRTKQLVHS